MYDTADGAVDVFKHVVGGREGWEHVRDALTVFLMTCAAAQVVDAFAFGHAFRVVGRQGGRCFGCRDGVVGFRPEKSCCQEDGCQAQDVDRDFA